MARQPQSRGTCTYCGKDFARGGMTKHLATCPARAAAFAAAEAGNGKTQALYHLTVSTPGSGLTTDAWMTLLAALVAGAVVVLMVGIDVFM